jgi:simple sugar transport system ATP-binding protein
MAVLFISAELDEVARISDRIAVLRDGRNIAQIDGGCPVSELTSFIATGSQR